MQIQSSEHDFLKIQVFFFFSLSSISAFSNVKMGTIISLLFNSHGYKITKHQYFEFLKGLT